MGMSWKQVCMMDIRQVVADPEWQRVKKSMQGKWQHGPELCVRTLRHYLQDSPTYEKNLRLRRVQNYLASSGFRSGKILKTSEIQTLMTDVTGMVEAARKSDA